MRGPRRLTAGLQLLLLLLRASVRHLHHLVLAVLISMGVPRIFV